MNKRQKIQKLISAFLLAVFTLAIAPKKIVHQWFASHTDVATKSSDNKTTLNTSGFNCQCDDQISESNFFGVILPAISPLFQSHPYLNQTTFSFVLVLPHFINLRGPPTKILTT